MSIGVGSEPGASKAEYRKLTLRQRIRRTTQPSADERDYDGGLRLLIRNEFVHAVRRSPHLLLLPLKAFGAFTLPPREQRRPPWYWFVHAAR